MASFNKVILIGNLTADPELKQTPNGVSVCRFTLAVNRRFARAEQGQQTADFITVVAWRQSASARFTICSDVSSSAAAKSVSQKSQCRLHPLKRTKTAARPVWKPSPWRL